MTRYFYLRGWRGINVEPQADMIELLQLDRPQDVNVHVGVSDLEGRLTFHRAAGFAGISTFNRDWREAWAERSGHEFYSREVQVTTLARVCERYAHRPIDFLKIDAEGHEEEVMAGADFSRWRPRVVLIEGLAGPWEPGLLASGYLFATSDGINRFYVRDEDRGLIPRLAGPVDGSQVILHHEFKLTLSLRDELAEEKTRHEATRRSLAEARARLRSTRDLGPSAVRLARIGKHLGRRHPRIAGLARRALGVTADRQDSA